MSTARARPLDGNEISEESQEAKFELVARVAHEAWG